MKIIKVSSSQYVSCCYYGLKQAGLVKSDIIPQYLSFGQQLAALGDEFAFKSPMAGGPIFSLLYQIPGYLDASPADFEKVLTGIKQYIEDCTITYFLKTWPIKTAYWQLWYTQPWNNYLHQKLKLNKSKAILIIEKFLDYLQDIWNDYSPIYYQNRNLQKQNSVSKLLNKLKPFSKWKTDLGISYPYNKFEIVFCSQTKSMASSLGPEKVVISSNINEQDLINSCFHEIGVRMYGIHNFANNPATKQLFIDDYLAIIKLIENEICYRKPRVINIDYDPFIKGMNLSKLYNWRINQTQSNDIFTSFAKWYSELKADKLL
ncbi:hypothetical protein IMX26_00730 [Clostridium sp. 'deep sea']|uniref:hypothetical protein n=1 Tax=Clostridium sp. 'deep sea' TaxID=2779445 RepID=UPI00189669BF|nr:hypothetical protein [Clostridium sp. 'deep sea']QOR35400.1 hypothetical protein IMX26_00730 [Clostridium sp. 'deep sea']